MNVDDDDDEDNNEREKETNRKKRQNNNLIETLEDTDICTYPQKNTYEAPDSMVKRKK